MLSIFISSWFWIPFTILGIWKAGRIYFYKGRPWRRIHYPMMRLYSKTAGMEAGRSEKENREFEVDRALFQLIKNMKQSWSNEKIQNYLEDCKIQCDEFSDQKLIIDYLQRKHPSTPKENLDTLLEKNRSFFDSSDRGVLVRMVIAGMIEEKYGIEHRAEYLVEVMRGKAT